jgi:hypothetical protein
VWFFTDQPVEHQVMVQKMPEKQIVGTIIQFGLCGALYSSISPKEDRGDILRRVHNGWVDKGLTGP